MATQTICVEEILVTQLKVPIWQQIAERHQKQRSNTMTEWSHQIFGKPIPGLPSPETTNVRSWPRTTTDLSDHQKYITESTPSRLLEKLASGEWSAEDVLVAFIARAIIAHHLTNPISEGFFDEALLQARHLDEHLRSTGRTVGPLHGLPISLKDVMNISGHASNWGFVALADRRPERSDDLVDRLATAGAVFYCKTNVPQSLMSGECVNYLFGRTCTPDNRSLSAGGSSGGEGSLIALGGSPLGIGTDIAGSIRTPANFNGIYGLCPSYGRLPCHSAEYTGAVHLINAVAGPLCRSLDGLEVYTRSVLALEPWNWDAACTKSPWDETLYRRFQDKGTSGGLVFGIVANDGVVQPHPPIQKGLRKVHDALIQAGHEVVEVKLFDGKERLWETAKKIYFCDGSKKIMETLAHLSEPTIAEMSPQPSETVALSAVELLQAGNEVTQIRQTLLDRWQATAASTRSGRPVDAFILPSGGHVAPPHGTMDYFLYEAISNILDWTCGTIPVGNVDANKDSAAANFNPLSKEDADNWAKYSPDAYRDGAVCLQVLGQRLTEEKVLACMSAIDGALGRSKDHMV